MNSRNIVVHIIRIVSYVILPFGVLGLLWDFIANSNSPNNPYAHIPIIVIVLQALVFLGSAYIIIFIHPTKTTDTTFDIDKDTQKKSNWPHVFTVIGLSVAGLILLIIFGFMMIVAGA